jgi:hypothetical protein
MGGRVDVKAVLQIAFSNKKLIIFVCLFVILCRFQSALQFVSLFELLWIVSPPPREKSPRATKDKLLSRAMDTFNKVKLSLLVAGATFYK